ncbi:MAG TPA: CPBP family intramembrane glutamic endopeptidase [Burkholderiaceae bacterium]|nr:CPBP family intramembrane glutamic endopeptidase [Burkholderiaceae bacterium]
MLAFFATTAVATTLYWTSRAVPLLRDNLHAVIAVLFYYAPVVATRRSAQPFDYREAGLTLRPLGLNAAVLAAFVAVAFPLFAAGFFLFYDLVCAATAHALPARLVGLCPGTWLGWPGGHWRLPPHFLMLAANQLIVVALPEEVFFRGYLLQRLEARFPPTHRLAGAPVGWALLLSAVLFALGHVLVDFNLQRLAVFFPALLFGWMRARTGSLAAGAAFHALCNLLSDVLHTSYF